MDFEQNEDKWKGRRWARPFLTVLAPAERHYHRRGRPHKKLTGRARQIAQPLRRWLPGCRLVLVGDNGYAVLDLPICGLEPVACYEGSVRTLGLASQTEVCYHCGKPPVPIRWAPAMAAALMGRSEQFVGTAVGRVGLLLEGGDADLVRLPSLGFVSVPLSVLGARSGVVAPGVSER